MKPASFRSERALRTETPEKFRTQEKGCGRIQSIPSPWLIHVSARMRRRRRRQLRRDCLYDGSAVTPFSRLPAALQCAARQERIADLCTDSSNHP
jgi:hypothetical protein